MAAGKIITTKRPCLLAHGFSLLEVMMTMFIMVIIGELMFQALLINTKITNRHDFYLNATYNNQYLYWLFYHQIAENYGIENIEKFLGKNIPIGDIDNKICLQKLIDKNLTHLTKITIHNNSSIWTAEDAVVKHFKKHAPTLSIDSNILIIKTLSLVEDQKDKVKPPDKIDQLCPKVFYKETLTAYFISNAKLYQLKDNRADELMHGVKGMKIHKQTKLAYDYYRFEIFYKDHDKAIVFMIKARSQ